MNKEYIQNQINELAEVTKKVQQNAVTITALAGGFFATAERLTNSVTALITYLTNNGFLSSNLPSKSNELPP